MYKKHTGPVISSGIFLISLGVLLYTGWWWPGIMIAIGLASGAELVFRGKILAGIASLAFFCSIPIVVWIIQEADVSWVLVGALILIGIGVIVLVKAFFLGEEPT